MFDDIIHIFMPKKHKFGKFFFTNFSNNILKNKFVYYILPISDKLHIDTPLDYI